MQEATICSSKEASESLDAEEPSETPCADMQGDHRTLSSRLLQSAWQIHVGAC